MSVKHKSKGYDLLGVSAALFCLVHCMVFPLMLFIPIGISHNPYIDLAFLLLGVWSVYKTTRQGGPVIVTYMLWLSVGAIAVSILMDIMLHWHGPLLYIGAFGLITGHLINLKNHHLLHPKRQTKNCP